MNLPPLPRLPIALPFSAIERMWTHRKRGVSEVSSFSNRRGEQSIGRERTRRCLAHRSLSEKGKSAMAGSPAATRLFPPAFIPTYFRCFANLLHLMPPSYKPATEKQRCHGGYLASCMCYLLHDTIAQRRTLRSSDKTSCGPNAIARLRSYLGSPLPRYCTSPP